MEPKLPAPERTPEYKPAPSILSPEIGSRADSEKTTLEQQERGVEQAVESRTSQSQPILPPPMVTPLPPLPAPDDTVLTEPTDDMPMVANDDDLIEKEWVDKAKQILVTTKDDPYRREKEVGKLQVEYLKKRYGKELAGQD